MGAPLRMAAWAAGISLFLLLFRGYVISREPFGSLLGMEVGIQESEMLAPKFKGAVFDPETGVYMIQEGFRPSANKKVQWILDFSTEWCGHCKSLVPEWIKLAQKLQGTRTMVGYVDCGTLDSFCSKCKIEGYPTIKLFKSGTVRTYLGHRTSKAMYRWLRKHGREFVSTNKTGLAALLDWIWNNL
ncbi:hypothetical protein AAMO2058_000853500 [Amorphochlora amoebiformis]